MTTGPEAAREVTGTRLARSHLWRPFASKLGRGVPPLGSPPSHPHRRRVQVPSSSIPTVSASPRHPPRTPPHLPPDPPSAPGPQDPDPSLPPTLHNSARLSPRGLRGRSTKGGAAAARLRMLLPPPPPSPPPSLLPPLPSTGPGALSQAMLAPAPGPPGRTRPERGMLRWSRGLLKEPAAAIRLVPGSSLVVRALHLPAGGDLERSHPRP
nr:WW domain-binding protein 11-like [Kogia breviceps]